MSTNLNITNNLDQHRFETELNGQLARIEYKREGSNIIFTHTEVPEAFEGQGIATKMVYHAMEYAKNEGLKVRALCPFVNKYVSEHPEYHDITWGYSKK